MARTSQTHPIRLDFAARDDVLGRSIHRGRIGMTFAPGKVQPNASTGAWKRDLELDLRRLRDVYGVTTLVSLVEDHELEELQISPLVAQCEAHGIECIRFPFPDMGVPEKLGALVKLTRRLTGRMSGGDTVAVHCKGGLGRTGVVAAATLIADGEPLDEAVNIVRRARPGAIENQRQERCVEAFFDAWSESRRHLVRGCLLGGALGDALGAPIEFDSLSAIRSRCGQGGPESLVGFGGEITDDTQMTLFTAEAMIRSRLKEHQVSCFIEDTLFNQALLRWLVTQEPETKLKSHDEAVRSGWLFEQEFLHARRAPGNTCLSSLRRFTTGENPWEPMNDSKGCGGVMRVAPCALCADDDPWELGGDMAFRTHHHPSGYQSAAFFACLNEAVMLGEPLVPAVRRLRAYGREREGEEFSDDLDGALEQLGEVLRTDGRACAEAISKLGQGWVAEEALVMAIYACGVSPDFESAVRLAVTHSGDSDSTGAMTGNLWGMTHGESSLPETWLDVLEGRDVIETVADMLHWSLTREVTEDERFAEG
jgi:ADP-ribosylglycohydrolase/protein-tyrosine phosphatase